MRLQDGKEVRAVFQVPFLYMCIGSLQITALSQRSKSETGTPDAQHVRKFAPQISAHWAYLTISRLVTTVLHL